MFTNGGLVSKLNLHIVYPEYISPPNIKFRFPQRYLISAKSTRLQRANAKYKNHNWDSHVSKTKLTFFCNRNDNHMKTSRRCFDYYSNPFCTVAIQQQLTSISKKWRFANRNHNLKFSSKTIAIFKDERFIKYRTSVKSNIFRRHAWGSTTITLIFHNTSCVHLSYIFTVFQTFCLYIFRWLVTPRKWNISAWVKECFKEVKHHV